MSRPWTTGDYRNKNKGYKFIEPLPYTLSIYSAKQDRDGAWRVNSGSALEGVVKWHDGSVSVGYTGMVERISSPTGYYDDRWSKMYTLDGADTISVSGATGSSGSFKVSWRANVQGFTGVAHGQYYGVTVQAGLTGAHSAAQIILKVDDTIG